jgi:hypothetical protein
LLVTKLSPRRTRLYTRSIVKKLLGAALLLGTFALHATSDVEHPESEFVFARVQFNMTLDALFEREAPWHHDYPYSEDFYLGMIQELTAIHTSHESYQIVELESPDIFHYPFLYFSEPGYMALTDAETDNLREYFNRGGFAMFDDFRGRDLSNLQLQMKKVFPEREMYRLDPDEPIFDSFFSIEELEMPSPYYDGRFLGENAQFWGMQDDQGRLVLIANYNNDFGEFWEWVDRAEMPFEPAALSVRFGVNYLIYSMTH